MAAPRNVKYTVVGDHLFIEVDLSKRYGESKSGKTEIVASTGGAKPLDDHPNLRMNLSVWED